MGLRSPLLEFGMPTLHGIIIHSGCSKHVYPHFFIDHSGNRSACIRRKHSTENPLLQPQRSDFLSQFTETVLKNRESFVTFPGEK